VPCITLGWTGQRQSYGLPLRLPANAKGGVARTRDRLNESSTSCSFPSNSVMPGTVSALALMPSKPSWRPSPNYSPGPQVAEITSRFSYLVLRTKWGCVGAMLNRDRNRRARFQERQARRPPRVLSRRVMVNRPHISAALREQLAQSILQDHLCRRTGARFQPALKVLYADHMLQSRDALLYQ